MYLFTTSDIYKLITFLILLLSVLFLSAIILLNMANPVWGLLAKAQDDDETIEEAIARLIDEHNEDEESHLGSGQSLQSH